MFLARRRKDIVSCFVVDKLFTLLILFSIFSSCFVLWLCILYIGRKQCFFHVTNFFSSHSSTVIFRCVSSSCHRLISKYFFYFFCLFSVVCSLYTDSVSSICSVRFWQGICDNMELRMEQKPKYPFNSSWKTLSCSFSHLIRTTYFSICIH